MESQPGAGSSKLKIPRADAQVGQKIWTKLVVDNTALVRPEGTISKSMKNIFSGKGTRKQGYIIKVEDSHLEVAYTTTFGNKEILSALVANPNAWYPIAPASTGNHPTLPAPVDEQKESLPCWVYLGPPVPVEDDPVEILPDKRIPTSSIDKIVAALVSPKNIKGQRGPIRESVELHSSLQTSGSPAPDARAGAESRESVDHPGEDHAAYTAVQTRDGKEKESEHHQTLTMAGEDGARAKETNTAGYIINKKE